VLSYASLDKPWPGVDPITTTAISVEEAKDNHLPYGP
jgi:hypothetical protein